VRQIEARFEPLRTHPELGPRREHLGTGLRVHFHRGYAIYYQPTKMALIIVRVVHGARDAAALLRDDPG
jgi:toxin ParE1/3/4